MNADFSESSNATPRTRQARGPIIALATAVCAVAVYAVVEAPTTWRAAERFKADQILQENRTYCEKFGIPAGSAGFAACVADLTEIRRRHGERVSAEAAGML